jgi:hypothetical protein
MVNCEIEEVLKNIRILKAQTEMLMGIRITKKESNVVKMALNSLSKSTKRFLE